MCNFMKKILAILVITISFSFGNNNDFEILTSNQWRLIYIMINNPSCNIVVPTDILATMTVHVNEYFGKDGCNIYNGKCSIRNDSIYFENPCRTKIFCPSLRDNVEDNLLFCLMRQSAKYLIIKDTLILTTKQHDIFKYIIMNR